MFFFFIIKQLSPLMIYIKNQITGRVYRTQATDIRKSNVEWTLPENVRERWRAATRSEFSDTEASLTTIDISDQENSTDALHIRQGPQHRRESDSDTGNDDISRYLPDGGSSPVNRHIATHIKRMSMLVWIDQKHK